MDIILIITGILTLLLGFTGCIIPALPGPPLGFVSLLLLHWTSKVQFSTQFLFTWAAVAIIVTILDQVVPVWGTKQFGGSKKGIRGSILGLIAGMFFPPVGIIIGPFAGAFIGEMINERNLEREQRARQPLHPQNNFNTSPSKTSKALKAATGALMGLLGGIILKLIATGYMAYYFFEALAA